MAVHGRLHSLIERDWRASGSTYASRLLRPYSRSIAAITTP
jgi:hypothetical protein